MFCKNIQSDKFRELWYFFSCAQSFWWFSLFFKVVLLLITSPLTWEFSLWPSSPFGRWARSHARVACKRRHECEELRCLLAHSLLAHSEIPVIYSRQYWAQITRSSGGRVGEEHYCLRKIARSGSTPQSPIMELLLAGQFEGLLAKFCIIARKQKNILGGRDNYFQWQIWEAMCMLIPLYYKLLSKTNICRLLNTRKTLLIKICLRYYDLKNTCKILTI